jgi:hypothetical protein
MQVACNVTVICTNNLDTVVFYIIKFFLLNILRHTAMHVYMLPVTRCEERVFVVLFSPVNVLRTKRGRRHARC